MPADEWWLDLDREAVREASAEIADKCSCLVLQGSFATGPIQALSIVESTLDELGFTCRNIAVYNTPGGFTNALLAMFVALSTPAGGPSLPVNLIEIREAVPEQAVAYLSAVVKAQDRQTAMLIDAIDEADALTERELAALEDLAVGSSMPIVMTTSASNGTPWQALTRSRIVELNHFTVQEVLAFVLAHTPSDTRLESLGELNRVLDAIRAVGSKGRVYPRDAYTVLTALANS